MAKELEAAKRRLGLVEGVFSAEEIYKEVRKVADKLKYSFVEKEQESKPAKYGQDRVFNFYLEKVFDDFAKGKIEIEIKFFNLNRVKVEGKELDRGDIDFVLTATGVFDHRNEWVMKRLNKGLFDFYWKYFMKEKAKRVYLKPLTEDAEKIYEAVKGKVDR